MAPASEQAYACNHLRAHGSPDAAAASVPCVHATTCACCVPQGKALIAVAQNGYSRSTLSRVDIHRLLQQGQGGGGRGG
jgi:hypothetical protein